MGWVSPGISLQTEDPSERDHLGLYREWMRRKGWALQTTCKHWDYNRGGQAEVHLLGPGILRAVPLTLSPEPGQKPSGPPGSSSQA